MINETLKSKLKLLAAVSAATLMVACGDSTSTPSTGSTSGGTTGGSTSGGSTSGGSTNVSATYDKVKQAVTEFKLSAIDDLEDNAVAALQVKMKKAMTDAGLTADKAGFIKAGLDSTSADKAVAMLNATKAEDFISAASGVTAVASTNTAGIASALNAKYTAGSLTEADLQKALMDLGVKQEAINQFKTKYAANPAEALAQLNDVALADAGIDDASTSNNAFVTAIYNAGKNASSGTVAGSLFDIDADRKVNAKFSSLLNDFLDADKLSTTIPTLTGNLFDYRNGTTPAAKAAVVATNKTLNFGTAGTAKATVYPTTTGASNEWIVIQPAASGVAGTTHTTSATGMVSYDTVGAANTTLSTGTHDLTNSATNADKLLPVFTPAGSTNTYMTLGQFVAKGIAAGGAGVLVTGGERLGVKVLTLGDVSTAANKGATNNYALLHVDQNSYVTATTPTLGGGSIIRLGADSAFIVNDQYAASNSVSAYGAYKGFVVRNGTLMLHRANSADGSTLMNLNNVNMIQFTSADYDASTNPAAPTALVGSSLMVGDMAQATSANEASGILKGTALLDVADTFIYNGVVQPYADAATANADVPGLLAWGTAAKTFDVAYSDDARSTFKFRMIAKPTNAGAALVAGTNTQVAFDKIDLSHVSDWVDFKHDGQFAIRVDVPAGIAPFNTSGAFQLFNATMTASGLNSQTAYIGAPSGTVDNTNFPALHQIIKLPNTAGKFKMNIAGVANMDAPTESEKAVIFKTINQPEFFQVYNASGQALRHNKYVPAGGYSAYFRLVYLPQKGFYVAVASSSSAKKDDLGYADIMTYAGGAGAALAVDNVVENVYGRNVLSKMSADIRAGKTSKVAGSGLNLAAISKGESDVNFTLNGAQVNASQNLSGLPVMFAVKGDVNTNTMTARGLETAFGYNLGNTTLGLTYALTNDKTVDQTTGMFANQKIGSLVAGFATDFNTVDTTSAAKAEVSLKANSDLTPVMALGLASANSAEGIVTSANTKSAFARFGAEYNTGFVNGVRTIAGAYYTVAANQMNSTVEFDGSSANFKDNSVASGFEFKAGFEANINSVSFNATVDSNKGAGLGFNAKF